jgi:hypothetical protein
MTLRTLLSSAALISLAPAALAAGEGQGHDTLFTPFTDTVTHLVMIGILIFFAILWRLGVFKTVLSSLDNRAEAIRKELAEVAGLRAQAAEALAQAERRQKEADREAETITAVGCIIAEIPCLDQIPLDDLKTGQTLVIDAEKGTVEVIEE